MGIDCPRKIPLRRSGVKKVKKIKILQNTTFRTEGIEGYALEYNLFCYIS